MKLKFVNSSRSVVKNHDEYMNEIPIKFKFFSPYDTMIWLDDDELHHADSYILCNKMLLQYTSTLHRIFIDSGCLFTC